MKKDEDKFLSLTLMAATSAVLCALALPLLPGVNSRAWPILGVSAILHAGYRICLSLGYKYGEMSQVYPIARGATPLFVALASVAMGLSLSAWQYLGILAIAVGIMGLTFDRGFPTSHARAAIGFALGTSAFIATFTLLDSKGARVSGHAYAYILWLFVLEGLLMLMAALLKSPVRLARYAKARGRTCLVNGLVMSAAHALIIVALSRSQPALVSALREVSVVFGVIFGAVFLKESVGFVRMLCTLAVTVGLFFTLLG
ncbi:transporter-like protein [Ramlibacter tataouinensis TTB310]|uniref:Transporter-like protein n=1 Tax=Ramlibacter tataouinensis (strain ATCC BAA-407 / DSM 14655 / LMG 21543 / TTB310) TaxID=365046 RepID=F5XXB2_RAMTT|nr:transporter-like protein [Ramlibacter tataouinensis TTB310]